MLSLLISGKNNSLSKSIDSVYQERKRCTGHLYGHLSRRRERRGGSDGCKGAYRVAQVYDLDDQVTVYLTEYGRIQLYSLTFRFEVSYLHPKTVIQSDWRRFAFSPLFELHICAWP